MQAVLDEVIEKVAQFSDEDRDKLIEALQKQKNKNQKNGEKDEVSQNTVWLRENRDKYGGMYVAIEDSKLVGQGKNFREADIDAKKNGSRKPFITYVFPADSEPFGGW